MGGIQTVAVVFYLTRLLLPRSHYCISLQTKRPGRMIYGCMKCRGDPNRWKLWAIIHHVYGSRAQLTYGTRIEAFAALLVYLPGPHLGAGQAPESCCPHNVAAAIYCPSGYMWVLCRPALTIYLELDGSSCLGFRAIVFCDTSQALRDRKFPLQQILKLVVLNLVILLIFKIPTHYMCVFKGEYECYS